MLKAFLNAFRVPDLRNKILFTLFIIVVYRFGSYVPVPVVDLHVLAAAAKNSQNNIFGFINLFSGGGLQRMAALVDCLAEVAVPPVGEEVENLLHRVRHARPTRFAHASES